MTTTNMKRALMLAVIGLMLTGTPVRAQEAREAKPDDRVIFDLSAEDWVTTKTAHVAVEVEAAVNSANAPTARADMLKAVNDVAKGDWRLTSFTRTQDQTGLDRWSATFEARLPETSLGDLTDQVKKQSKPGMQLTIGNIDFSPTLDEMESARNLLRAQIYKQAGDQLMALNSSLPGRNYRISIINFTGGEDEPAPMPQVYHGPIRAMASAMAAATAIPESSNSNGIVAPPVERAQKIMMKARIVLAAMPTEPVRR